LKQLSGQNIKKMFGLLNLFGFNNIQKRSESNNSHLHFASFIHRA